MQACALWGPSFKCCTSSCDIEARDAVVKACGRKYSPAKALWLVASVATLMSLYLVFLNPRVCRLVPNVNAQERGVSIVSGYLAVNSQIEKVPVVMTNQETDMAQLIRARVWKARHASGLLATPLSVEAQAVFTITTPTGLYTHLRVPQGVLCYFQAVLTLLLESLHCEVWVDYVVYLGRDPTELFDTSGAILGRLENVGLFVAAHKYTFLDTKIC